MRALLGLMSAAVLASSGCTRAARATQLRANVIRAGLSARSFADPPEVALEKILAVAPLEASCNAAGCSAFLEPPQLFDPACVTLAREGSGTRVELPNVWWVDEAVVRQVWRALDAPSLERAVATQDEAAERALRQEEASFGNRFGLTGGLHVGIGNFDESVDVGGRIGARWWHTPFLLTAYVVEYEHIYWAQFKMTSVDPYEPGFLAQLQEDELAFTFRLESGRFTGFSARYLGAPEVSLAAIGSATVLLTEGGRLLPGWRVGVGAYFNHYSQSVAIPFFCELTRTAWFGSPLAGVRAACGVGL